MRRIPIVLALALAIGACSDDAATTTSTTGPPTIGATTSTTTTTAPPETTTTTEPPPPPPLESVTLQPNEVADGFDQPVFVTGRPGDDLVYAVDQSGRIHAFRPFDEERRVVFDIAGRVAYGGEQGLLGIAFHPDDPSRLFVHYSRSGDGAGVLEEFRFPLDAAAADPDPVRRLLVVSQPRSNHNGGMIAFGPDGFLYMALGDGGGGGDPFRQGQNPFTLLGAILRLDVDGGDPYGIPPDNPFADGEHGAPEVWAYGLRNPWRFSFDGDDLWIADVGQGDWEEVNLVTVGDGGVNFGWPVLEATHCLDGPASLCDDNDFVDPIFEYTIRNEPRCAVTGGFVYRGSAIPDLVGAYLFGDHCSGEIMGLRVEDGDVTEHHVFGSMGERITSFGTDEDGEIYVVTVRAVYLLTQVGP